MSRHSFMLRDHRRSYEELYVERFQKGNNKKRSHINRISTISHY